jgi:hypothetical protein
MLSALGAIAVLISLLGAGTTSRAQLRASVRVSELVPHFTPTEQHYVSRCGRGAPPIVIRSGSGTAVTVGSRPIGSGVVRLGSPPAPGEDFTIGVDAGESRRTYRVRCLPADFPRWRFRSYRGLGRGLYTVSFMDEGRPWVIVFDQGGTPRWWYRPSTRVLWSQVLPGGTLSMARSFGDGYGIDPRMAEEIRSPSGRLLRVVRTAGTITDGHEFEQTGRGDFLIDSYEPAGQVDLRRFGGPRRASAVFAEIQQVDRRGHVVWRWNSRGRIGLRETGRWWHNVLANGKRDRFGATAYDAVHINSIEPRGHDELVVSMRHTDAVYGVRKSTGEITWKLGGTHTPASLRMVGDPARRVFGGQHDARVDGGVLSVFDNGKDRPRRPRVAFYRLHLATGTARFLGQLNDPEVSRSHCCGSARPFAGGWLVSWGDNPLVSAFTPARRLAFRLRLPAPTYRAVPVPAGVLTGADLERGMEAMERASRRPSPAG